MGRTNSLAKGIAAPSQPPRQPPQHDESSTPLNVLVALVANTPPTLPEQIEEQLADPWLVQQAHIDENRTTDQFARDCAEFDISTEVSLADVRVGPIGGGGSGRVSLSYHRIDCALN